jgi:hypothetical protein
LCLRGQDKVLYMCIKDLNLCSENVP